MMDFQITRGKQERAQKVLIYGQHGVGKTTFAACFHDAVFIDTEGGTAEFDVARLPAPTSWEMFLSELQWVGTNCAGGTVVVDSIDWAENMCTTYVCNQKGWADIESPGYGKGYVAIKDEFRNLLRWFDWLQGMAVNVVVVAHEQITTITAPGDAVGYSVHGLKLSKHVAPLLMEWADAVLYCHFKTTVLSDGKNKAHAIGGTERVIQTTHTATIDAKNRWGLDGEIPMDYKQIAGFIPGSKEGE